MRRNVENIWMKKHDYSCFAKYLQDKLEAFLKNKQEYNYSELSDFINSVMSEYKIETYDGEGNRIYNSLPEQFKRRIVYKMETCPKKIDSLLFFVYNFILINMGNNKCLSRTRNLKNGKRLVMNRDGITT